MQKIINGELYEVVVAVDSSGNDMSGSGGGAGSDRELVVSTYRVKTAFAGASVGDTVTATQIIDVTGTPGTVSTIWRNQTTAADLAGAPAAANLELTGSTALTAAQLAAAALATEATLAAVLAKLNAGVGIVGQVEVMNDTGNAMPVSLASSPLPTGAATELTLNDVKATLQQTRDRLPPTQKTPGFLSVDTLGTPGASYAQATSSAAANIALTATCRRVSMYATQDAWYSISGAASSASHFIARGERLDFDVPASTTISVLQDGTAGSIRVTELA